MYPLSFKSFILLLSLFLMYPSNRAQDCPARLQVPNAPKKAQIDAAEPEITGMITVPVVFHIVLEDSDQVTYNEVQEQLARLNDGFNPKSLLPVDPRFQGDAAKANIQFELLADSFDPRMEKGIIRKKATGPYYRSVDGQDIGKLDNISDLFFDTQGGSDAVMPGKCINIWITDLKHALRENSETALVTDDLEAFASYPIQFNQCPDTDGLVMDYEFFQEETHTIVHEMGHYLGLYHLWGLGKGCSDHLVGVYDDQIPDTHPQPSGQYIRNPFNKNCSDLSIQNSCNIAYGEPFMLSNYMGYGLFGDNNIVDCRNFFTAKQVRWMRAQFNEGMPREDLLWWSKAKNGDMRGATATREEIVALIDKMLEEQIVGTWDGTSPMLVQYVNMRDQKLVISNGINGKKKISIREASSDYVMEEGELVRIPDQARWVASIGGRKYWIDLIDPDLIRVVDSDLVNMFLNNDRSKTIFDKTTYFVRKDWVNQGQPIITDGSLFRGEGREDENVASSMEIFFSADSMKISAEWPLSEEFRSKKFPDGVLSVPSFQFKNAVFINDDQEQKWVSQTNKWTRLDNPTTSGNPKATFYRGSQTGIFADLILKVYPDKRGILYKIESGKIMREVGPIGDRTLLPELGGKIGLAKIESPFVPAGTDPFGKDMFEGEISIMDGDLWALAINNQLIFCPSPYFMMPPSYKRKTNHSFGFKEWADLLQVYGMLQGPNVAQSPVPPRPSFEIVQIKPTDPFATESNVNSSSPAPQPHAYRDPFPKTGKTIQTYHAALPFYETNVRFQVDAQSGSLVPANLIPYVDDAIFIGLNQCAYYKLNRSSGSNPAYLVKFEIKEISTSSEVVENLMGNPVTRYHASMKIEASLQYKDGNVVYSQSVEGSDKSILGLGQPTSQNSAITQAKEALAENITQWFYDRFPYQAKVGPILKASKSGVRKIKVSDLPPNLKGKWFTFYFVETENIQMENQRLGQMKPIAKGRFSGDIGNNTSEVTISSGGDDLAQAIASGKKLSVFLVGKFELFD